MEVRLLKQQEHGKTRLLWEKVFQEDSKAFLDYYYFFKTRENSVYVVEEDEEIRSMLHLNPFLIQVGEGQFDGRYIIAVATEESYRKRGYMGMLLRKAMQAMYQEKQPFTFLMPAAEAIYTPYDFRFVYDQNVWKYTVVEKQEQKSLPVSEAGIGDGADLAAFFMEYFSERFQIYAVRDEQYYQTMLFEQQSENGGIAILKRSEKIVGCFLYGDEDGLEIREPLYLKEYETEFWAAVGKICEKHGQKEALVYAGISEEEKIGTVEFQKKKPTIMVRILHLESLLRLLKTKAGEQIDCSFAVLDSILTQNSRVWKLQSSPIGEIEEGEDTAKEVEKQRSSDCKTKIYVRETEDSEGVLSIAALTSLLFGYKSVEEVAEDPDVFLSERLMGELKKIQPLDKIYLNEIV
ncbi:GNAT family N-acetyltransferase [Mediterraneibacter glycyrrhizinilyticus]|uniref:GNAT family N-acetyltransferase n=1 Tax=Mediterraneibacter glycyrrhizinilyticus TaxID=342942 RepID=UPI001D06BBF7|nr:GNAT family N-acetyltransferase [Mediterraneibacter glycyrrhizinilyticus]MCB6309073.1 GNAT family N-acetyltransferase [Lachnospiraceae bacterium 210521-DFI.1.109]MCB6426419.1 GNAT family N-acetyltransferase [Mediterraneibacter glycyrrhizinilyticus]